MKKKSMIEEIFEELKRSNVGGNKKAYHVLGWISIILFLATIYLLFFYL